MLDHEGMPVAAAEQVVVAGKIEKLPESPSKYPEPAMAFGKMWSKVNEIIEVLNASKDA